MFDHFIFDVMLIDPEPDSDEHFAAWEFIITPIRKEFERCDRILEFDCMEDMITFSAPPGIETGDEDELTSVLWDRWPELAKLIDDYGCEHEYVAASWIAVTKKGWIPDWKKYNTLNY